MDGWMKDINYTDFQEEHRKATNKKFWSNVFRDAGKMAKSKEVKLFFKLMKEDIDIK